MCNFKLDTMTNCLGFVDKRESNDGMLLTSFGLAPLTQAANCDHYD